MTNKTMNAIVKTKASQGGLELMKVPFPILKDGEVLIKIKKTAICGTDLHIYNWDEWAQRTIRTPQIIGHEFVGEVVETRGNMPQFKPGQLVSGEGHIVCSTCRQCITGLPHLCRQTVGIGVNIDGVFSEYISIPAGNVWICDSQIPLNVLSIQDPLGNAVHSSLAFDVLGEDVLITGAGPIGLMSIPIVKRAGARNIVVSDINPARLELAKKLGATAVLDVKSQKIADILPKLNMVEGFDVGLEMSGNAVAFSDMVDNMANGGKIAILGILPSKTLIDWDKVVFRSLTLMGIYGRRMYYTWYKMTALLQSGLAEDVLPIITHEYDYDRFEEAFDVMKSGLSGKVVLNWEK